MNFLSNQKEVVANKGVGFAPNSKNKKKDDKTKRPPPIKQTFVKEGVLGNVAEIQNFPTCHQDLSMERLATRGRRVHLHTLVDR